MVEIKKTRGRPAGRNYDTNLPIRITKNKRDEFKILCSECGSNMNDVLRNFIDLCLEQRNIYAIDVNKKI